ncbi:MAG: FAD-binding oxidoreductase, partial [bacterium]|nr:FAD-binding oxidoreductase [bacterium]
MSVLAALARELGEAQVGSTPARDSSSELDGSVRPRTGEELATALGVVAAARASVVVRGGGSWDGLGHPMPRARILLETAGLQSVPERGDPEIDSEDGVAHLPAGASVSWISERVRKETGGTWELPFDPVAPTATLGGCLATAS